MERKLMDYLPYVVRDYPQFKGIIGAQQSELELVWEAAGRLLDNQFLPSADEWGISRWENILGISPKGTQSLEERRFTVLSRINEQLPYTVTQLRNMLGNLCGKGNFSVEIPENSYQLVVRVWLEAKDNLQAVDALLRRVAPENLVIDLSLLYNTHAALAPYTHAQLASYTHQGLKEEELS